MANENELLDLVGGIYEAGADPSQWPVVLNRLAQAVNAPIAGLLYHDVATNRGHISAIVGADPTGTHLYNTHYHALDPWVRRATGAGLIKTGEVMVGHELVSHEDLRRTEYYNDFALAYDGVRLLAGIVLRTGSIFSNISLLRGEKSDPFSADEKRFLNALMPHLHRAIAIHRRIDQLRSLSASAVEAFNRMPFAVFLLDQNGEVLFSNDEAGRILKHADGLRFHDGRLKATIAAEDTILQRLIQGATLDSNRKPSIGSAATLSRRSGKSPLQVLVTPLPGSAPFSENQRVAVFITDPEHRSVPPTEVLRACFGFSPAETRVVRELLDGRSVSDISAQLSLTENTVRSYLKAILAKTGCRSQTALVALLLRSVAALTPSDAHDSSGR